MTASDSSAAGDVYASPVATYRTPRRGSMVGDDQIAAPAGPHICVPIDVFFVFISGVAIVSLFQICSPLAASYATMLPRNVQHSYCGPAPDPSSSDETGTYTRPS